MFKFKHIEHAMVDFEIDIKKVSWATWSDIASDSADKGAQACGGPRGWMGGEANHELSRVARDVFSVVQEIAEVASKASDSTVIRWFCAILNGFG